MKSRILFVTQRQFGYHWNHYYAKYLRDSYNIDYLCHDMGMVKVDMPGVNIFYLPFHKNKIKRILLFLNKIIHLTFQNKYDIVLYIYFKYVFMAGLLSKCKNKLLFIPSGSLQNNFIKRKLINIIIRLNSYFFKKIIVHSVDIIKYLSLSDKKTIVIPLGAPIISNYIKSYEKLHLLYIGTFYQRNIKDTLIGFHKFIKKYNYNMDIKYDIIGYGPKNEEKVILDTIHEYKLNNYVKYHGRKNHYQAVEFFNKANVGICYVPIKEYFQDQVSTKLFEYILSGMHTIATNTKENKKYINSENGILCLDNPESFYESLIKVYKNRKYFDSNKIRQSLYDYSWEKIVNNKVKPLLKEDKKHSDYI